MTIDNGLEWAHFLDLLYYDLTHTQVVAPTAFPYSHTFLLP
jgi:hypothetical protein